jgi:hypothetical protein
MPAGATTSVNNSCCKKAVYEKQLKTITAVEWNIARA